METLEKRNPAGGPGSEGAFAGGGMQWRNASAAGACTQCRLAGNLDDLTIARKEARLAALRKQAVELTQAGDKAGVRAALVEIANLIASRTPFEVQRLEHLKGLTTGNTGGRRHA